MSQNEVDDLGLHVDMLDVDSLRARGANGDAYLGSLADRLDQTVRDIGVLRSRCASNVGGVSLCPDLAADAFGVGLLLGDQGERIRLLEGVILDIRHALGEDGLHALLLDLPKVVAERVGGACAKG